MKSSLLLPALLFLFAVQGFAQTVTRELSTFDELKVSTGIEAVLIQSNEAKVVLEFEEIDEDEVATDVRGGELSIYIDRKNVNYDEGLKVKATVYYTDLKKVKATSAATIKGTSPIEANDFLVDVSSAGNIKLSLKNIDELDVEASSAGRIELTVLSAKETTISASSAGYVDIEGVSKSIDMKTSSAAIIQAKSLKAETGKVKASSSGIVKVHCTESIDADASSGSIITVKGSPKRQNTNSSSGGNISVG